MLQRRLEHAPGHLGDVIYLQSNNPTLSALPSPHLQSAAALPCYLFLLLSDILQNRCNTDITVDKPPAILQQCFQSMEEVSILIAQLFLLLLFYSCCYTLNWCRIMKQSQPMLSLKPQFRDIHGITYTCKMFSV